MTDEPKFEGVVYCPETGKLNVHVYSAKGGYLFFTHKGKKYAAHRVAWFLHYGSWPKNQIDHINGNPSDNRICNLRDVTGSVNMQNLRVPRRDGTSGYLGVTWNKQAKKWKAQIRVNGEKKFLGYFLDAKEAFEAYLNAKRKWHEGCTI